MMNQKSRKKFIRGVVSICIATFYEDGTCKKYVLCMECCDSYVLTRRWLTLRSPVFGSNFPNNKLRRVDFPTPLGPTIAIRLSISRPNSMLLNSFGWPEYPNVTSEQYEVSCRYWVRFCFAISGKTE